MKMIVFGDSRSRLNERYSEIFWIETEIPILPIHYGSEGKGTIIIKVNVLYWGEMDDIHPKKETHYLP